MHVVVQYYWCLNKINKVKQDISLITITYCSVPLILLICYINGLTEQDEIKW